MKIELIKKSSSEKVKSIIILVPGTFSMRKGENTKVGDWFSENSTFIKKITDETKCAVSLFSWDTKNDHESRNASSVYLANKINNSYSHYEKIFILSHSHGGNISFSAIKNISDKLVPKIKLITMGTPFITMGTATMKDYYYVSWYFFLFLFMVTLNSLQHNLVDKTIPILSNCFIYFLGGIYGLAPIYFKIKQKKQSNSAPYEASVNYRGDILRNVVPIHIMRTPYDEAFFATSIPGFLYSISKLATDICIAAVAAPIVKVMPGKPNETSARKYYRIILKLLLILFPIFVYFIYSLSRNIKCIVFFIDGLNCILVTIVGILFISSFLACFLSFVHVISYKLLGMGQMGLYDADISIDSTPDHGGIAEVRTYLTDAGRLSPLRMRHSLYNDPACVSDIISIIKEPPSAEKESFKKRILRWFLDRTESVKRLEKRA